MKHPCLVMIMGSEGQIKSRSQGYKTRGQGLGCLSACLVGVLTYIMDLTCFYFNSQSEADRGEHFLLLVDKLVSWLELNGTFSATRLCRKCDNCKRL